MRGARRYGSATRASQGTSGERYGIALVLRSVFLLDRGGNPLGPLLWVYLTTVALHGLTDAGNRVRQSIANVGRPKPEDVPAVDR